MGPQTRPWQPSVLKEERRNTTRATATTVARLDIGQESAAPLKRRKTKAQTSSTDHKPENKLMGSANAITVHDYEGDGFWMVKDKAVDPAPNVSAEPDPLLDALDEIEDASLITQSPSDCIEKRQ